jgi:hypothetical protein
MSLQGNEMFEKQESKDSLVIANEVCQRLTKKLQKRLTAENPLEVKRFYFIVLCLKEALLYRSTELASTAIDLYQQNKLVSAATITRSLLETTALFERLREICAKFVKKYEKHGCRASDIQGLVQSIGKIGLSTTDPAFIKNCTVPEMLQNSTVPFLVSKVVKSLGTRFKFDAEGVYASLCQTAHPNFPGCLGTFADWQENYVEFIHDYHHMPEQARSHQSLLADLLLTVEKLEEEMTGLLPMFATVCEEYCTEQLREIEGKSGDTLLISPSH